MKLYGLIGYPLSHSFSQKYFKDKFKKESLKEFKYENFELKSIGEFHNLIQQQPILAGLNVTIPYKQQIMGMLDCIDKEANEIGAVNCIKVDRSGKEPKLIGYNTDIYGFENALRPLLKHHHKKALILGTGGSSKAVAFALKKLGIEFLLISRSPSDCNQIRYTILNETILKEHTLIVNTTPLGMFPNVEYFPPIPYEHICENHLLFDLIYNPDKTRFLRNGGKQGATIINGYEMLRLQAERSWEIWNGK
ncbi:MAG: shikimate dehydrogenase [Bacteroidales bacterium]